MHSAPIACTPVAAELFDWDGERWQVRRFVAAGAGCVPYYQSMTCVAEVAVPPSPLPVSSSAAAFATGVSLVAAAALFLAARPPGASLPPA